MWKSVVVRVVGYVDIEDFFNGGVVIVGYAYSNGERSIGLEIKYGGCFERTVGIKCKERVAARAVSIDQGISQRISVIGIGCVELADYATRRLIFLDGKG